MKGLTRLVMRGLAWVGARRLAATLLWAGRLAILARLLEPGDFGAFAVGLLTVSLADALTASGLREALVQRPGAVADHLPSVWTVELVRGAVLSLLLALSAGPVAQFFAIPAAEVVLAIVCWLPLIDSLTNIALVELRRAMRFEPLFTYEIGGAAIDTAIAVIAAMLLGDARALALGTLLGRIGQVVISYLVHPYAPKLQLHWTRVRELFSFGRWILATQVIATITGGVIEAAIGKGLGAAALGLYRVSTGLAVMPMSELRTIVEGVLFPAYATIQDDPPRLRRSHQKAMTGTCLAAATLALVTVIAAPMLVRLVLGPDWLEAIPIVRLLACWSFAGAAGAPAVMLLNAVGRPKTVTLILAATLLPCAAAALPAVMQWGLTGIIWTFLAATWLAAGLATELGRRVIGAPALPTLGPLLLLGSILLAALVLTS
jgi:O-antigen/teichoic acid export membrane protein